MSTERRYDPKTVEPIGSDDANGGIFLGKLDHSSEALRKQPIIRVQEFTVPAAWRNLRQGEIVVFHSSQEPAGVLDTDTRIFSGITPRDFERSVRAAIVDDDVLPVLISLGQHALDALGKILLAVIDWSQDADQRVCL